MYAEIATAGLLLGAWTALSPGWKDTVEMATGRSWSHHVRRQVQEAERADAKWITKVGRYASDLLPKIDRALWWMAAIEGAQEALTTWISMAMKLKPCPGAPGLLEGTSKIPVDGRPLYHGWMTGPHFLTEEGSIVPIIGGNLSVPPGWGGGLFVGGRFSNFFSGGRLNVAMRMLNGSGGQYDYCDFDRGEDDRENSGPSTYMSLRPQPFTQYFHNQVQLASDEYPLVWECSSGYCKEWLYPSPELHPFDIRRDVNRILDQKKRQADRLL